MPSLDLWRQAIDDAAIREGVFVNNTGDFWWWLQNVHYGMPKVDFSEKLAMEILDDIVPLVKAYRTWKEAKR